MRLLRLVFLLPLVVCAVACKDAAAEQRKKDEAEAKKDVPLGIDDIEVGEGEEMKAAYRVMVTYVGRYPGGEASFDRNDQKDEDGKPAKPPYVIVIGRRKAIPGFEDGIIGMKKGGTRKITVPWQKGYGLHGSPDGGIKPKTDLEFTVTLHDFVRPGEDDKFDYTDIKAGTGREAKEGDKVTVHYEARYTNGMVFDDSRKRGEGGTPFVFRVGANDAIQGVDFGVRGMKVGGVREVWVPPLLAFDETGFGAMAGGQIVLVKVWLLHVE
jgi:peptidylprolyl isomerase